MPSSDSHEASDYTTPIAIRNLLSSMMLVTPKTKMPATVRDDYGDKPMTDFETFCVRWNGKSCELRNGKPFQLFERLNRRPGIYISVEDLIDEIWPGYEVERNTVQQTASRLQRLLKQAGMGDLRIEGKKNPGYYALVIESPNCQ